MRWFYKCIRLEHPGQLLPGCEYPWAGGLQAGWCRCLRGSPRRGGQASPGALHRLRGCRPAGRLRLLSGCRVGELAGAAQYPPAFLPIVGRRHCLRLGLMSFCVSVFGFVPTHFRGLSTGTVPLAPGPNADCSAGLEYEESLVTPENFSLGSSIRQAGPCLLGWSSSCFMDCFCFLPSFEICQLLLSSCGATGRSGRKAFLWLVRDCFSVALCSWK